MGDGHIHKYMCVFVWVLTPDRLTEAKSIGGSGEEAWADLVTEAEGMTVVLHRVMARGPSASRLGVYIYIYIYIYVCVCVCIASADVHRRAATSIPEGLAGQPHSC